MSLKIAFATAISFALLSGCVSSTQEAAPTRATNGNIAQRAGFDAQATTRQADRKGFDSTVDAGLAVGMARDFGGAGLGLGVLGWLSGSGDTGWSAPTLLATVPSNANIAAYEARYAELLLKSSGQSPERQGYTRVTTTSNPNFVTFVQPGCPQARQGYYKRTCSKTFGVQLLPSKGQGVYVVRVTTTDGSGDMEPVYRRMAASMPKELALYLPPHKAAGKMVPAKLIENGRETTL